MMKHNIRKVMSFVLISVLCLLALTSCGSKSADYEIAQAGFWTDGTYTEVADGKNGIFEVTVTIEGGYITSVVVGDNEETEEKGGKAIEELIPVFIQEQTWDIDGVSKATVTSDALKEAVARCLEAASKEALETAQSE